MFKRDLRGAATLSFTFFDKRTLFRLRERLDVRRVERERRLVGWQGRRGSRERRERDRASVGCRQPSEFLFDEFEAGQELRLFRLLDFELSAKRLVFVFEIGDPAGVFGRRGG
jgi:hypothetical protein